MKLTKDMLTEMVKEVMEEQMEEIKSKKKLININQLFRGIKNDGYEWNNEELSVFYDVGRLLRYFKVEDIGLENGGKGPLMYLTLKRRAIKNHPLDQPIPEDEENNK